MIQGREGLRHEEEAGPRTPAKELALQPDEAIDEEEIKNERERSGKGIWADQAVPF